MKHSSKVIAAGVLAAAGWGCAHSTPPGKDVAAAGPARRVVLVAGGGSAAEGPATAVKLDEPFAVALDPAHPGGLYISEHGGNRLRRMDPSGSVSIVAGTGTRGFSGDGPALQAQLAGPHHILFAPDGALLVADTFNNRVRRYDPGSGTITTIAGTGTKGFSGDGGPAAEAQTGNIFCLALDPSGRKLYVDDLPNKRIRVVDLGTGVITTFAGNGGGDLPEDGALAINAPLKDPRAVAADRKGNVYVVSRNGHLMWVIDAQGKIRRVAGTGQAGFGGDGGDARAAAMNGPKHISVDNDDNVLITDTENHAIRKYVAADGRMMLVAGTGHAGAAGVGGPPEAVQLNRPHGAVMDAAGAIYIADSENHRVLKIE